MTNATFETQILFGVARDFLGACGQDDDEGVAKYLEPETVEGLHMDPSYPAAQYARNWLGGLSTGDCARLAAFMDDHLDESRSGLFLNGVYLVLRDGDRQVRLAVRDDGDRFTVFPGADLGIKAGIRIRLTRKRSNVGGQSVLARQAGS